MATYHYAWKIQARPSPAKYHIARDLEKEIADEEDRHCQGVVGRGEAKGFGHARLFSISNAETCD